MKKKLLPIVSHNEMKEREEKKEIDFSTCPYCGSPMRLRLVRDDRHGNVRPSGYFMAAYDSVQFICTFCRSTSPIICLTNQIIDEEKVKERMINEYIECDYDEDEEEESND